MVQLHLESCHNRCRFVERIVADSASIVGDTKVSTEDFFNAKNFQLELPSNNESWDQKWGYVLIVSSLLRSRQIRRYASL